MVACCLLTVSFDYKQLYIKKQTNTILEFAWDTNCKTPTPSFKGNPIGNYNNFIQNCIVVWIFEQKVHMKCNVVHTILYTNRMGLISNWDIYIAFEVWYAVVYSAETFLCETNIVHVMHDIAKFPRNLKQMKLKHLQELKGEPSVEEFWRKLYFILHLNV